MVKLIATSVVRGSHQGESHGGVYLIDFDNEVVHQTLDWNTADIDWQAIGTPERVGLTAGASAPDILVEEVVAAFRQRFEVTIEDVAVARESVQFKLPRALAG